MNSIENNSLIQLSNIEIKAEENLFGINDFFPNEIIREIFSFLSPADLKVTSLICKHWKPLSFQVWTQKDPLVVQRHPSINTHAIAVSSFISMNSLEEALAQADKASPYIKCYCYFKIFEKAHEQKNLKMVLLAASSILAQETIKKNELDKWVTTFKFRLRECKYHTYIDIYLRRDVDNFIKVFDSFIDKYFKDDWERIFSMLELILPQSRQSSFSFSNGIKFGHRLIINLLNANEKKKAWDVIKLIALDYVYEEQFEELLEYFKNKLDLNSLLQLTLDKHYLVDMPYYNNSHLLSKEVDIKGVLPKHRKAYLDALTYCIRNDESAIDLIKNWGKKNKEKQNVVVMIWKMGEAFLNEKEADAAWIFIHLLQNIETECQYTIYFWKDIIYHLRCCQVPLEKVVNLIHNHKLDKQSETCKHLVSHDPVLASVDQLTTDIDLWSALYIAKMADAHSLHQQLIKHLIPFFDQPDYKPSDMQLEDFVNGLIRMKKWDKADLAAHCASDLMSNILLKRIEEAEEIDAKRIENENKIIDQEQDRIKDYYEVQKRKKEHEEKLSHFITEENIIDDMIYSEEDYEDFDEIDNEENEEIDS